MTEKLQGAYALHFTDRDIEQGIYIGKEYGEDKYLTQIELCIGILSKKDCIANLEPRNSKIIRKK